MPAVQLSRLSAEIGELVWLYTRPDDFLKSLQSIFERYATWVYRPGQTVRPVRSIEAYRVPPLVLQRVELEMNRLVQENPAAGSLVAERLWNSEFLETRQVGAHTLGCLPVNPPDAVCEQLRAWIQPGVEPILVQTALQEGGTQLRRQAPGAWVQLSRGWLENPAPFSQKAGLLALTGLVREPEFENLPLIFEAIASLVRNPPHAVQAEILALLGELGRRSSRETAFFLKQILLLHPTPAGVRLARKILPVLKKSSQDSLRDVLKLQSAKPPGEAP